MLHFPLHAPSIYYLRKVKHCKGDRERKCRYSFSELTCVGILYHNTGILNVNKC